MFKSRSGLTSELIGAGLGRHAAQIGELARPRLHFVEASTAPNEPSPGATKFGGCPELREGMGWPYRAAKARKANPNTFADDQEDDAMVKLGLNRNMVRYLRFWVGKRRSQPDTSPASLSRQSAPVVHGNNAVAEWLRRDQLELSRARQAALVQGGAVADDPGLNKELVLFDQIQPIQLSRELAATEEDARRGRVLQLLHARSQITRDVVAIVPREVASR